jgi:hypothetical protein
MFRVRKEQKEAFSQERVRDFEERMLAHLHRYFGSLCDALGDRPVLAMIRHGEERAAAHGLDTERSVSAYIHVMFLLGRDFDADPRHAWAAAILASSRDPDRGPRLLEAALARTRKEAS